MFSDYRNMATKKEPNPNKKLTKEEMEKKKGEEDKQLKEELELCVTRLGIQIFPVIIYFIV